MSNEHREILIRALGMIEALYYISPTEYKTLFSSIIEMLEILVNENEQIT